MSLHPRAPAGRGERRVRRSPPSAGACLPNEQRSPRSPPTLGFSRVAFLWVRTQRSFVRCHKNADLGIRSPAAPPLAPRFAAVPVAGRAGLGWGVSFRGCSPQVFLDFVFLVLFEFFDDRLPAVGGG